MLSIGLGLFIPTGELSNRCSTGKELMAQVRRYSLLTEIRVINFNRNKLNLDSFELLGGVEVTYKKIYINIGIGGYYIREILNDGYEREIGLCSSVGLSIPFYLSDSTNITPKISYSWVPKGISLGLNVGVNL